jgi:hypothetical protein
VLVKLCTFSSLTDNYLGTDDNARYGLVTPKGLISFSDSNDPDP